MIRSPKALGVNLIDVLGPRRARGKPAACGRHLQPADGSVVARRASENGFYFFAREFGDPDFPGREFSQQFLLFRRGRCLDAVINGLAESARHCGRC